MLSLITHEPHFYIIRESLNENAWKKCEFCGQTGHFRDDCKKLNHEKTGVKPPEEVTGIQALEFSLIKVHVVREYLQIEVNL